MNELSGIILRLSCCGLMIAATTTANTPGAEDQLVGKWHQKSDPALTLTFTHSGDTLKMTETKGDKVQLEFDCNTLGKECEAKREGHAAKVSVWFNGPKMIVLETDGSKITRQRFQVAENGDTLSVEVSEMSAVGKPEHLSFVRDGKP